MRTVGTMDIIIVLELKLAALPAKQMDHGGNQVEPRHAADVRSRAPLMPALGIALPGSSPESSSS